jgi:sugar phosphate isomerase/epimerase
MKLGAMDYIVAAADERATFARAARLGLAGVEINVRRGDLREVEPARLQRLTDAAKGSGLAVCALVLGEHNNGGVGSDDEAAAEAAREDIRAAVDWAAQLGAHVILVPFFFRGDLVTEAQRARATEAFRELCPLAHERGVTLCYEGTLPAAAIRAMAEAVGSPAFGCYFDLANVVWRGMDTATEIRALGPLIRQVHIKETHVGAGDVHPGQGRVDYAEAAAALREIGYDGWLVLETPAAPDPLVARDISFTRRIFPEIAWVGQWPRLGAFSYGFERGELARMIDTFRTLGLSVVQLGGPLLDDALDDPQEVRDALEGAGFDIVALAAYRNLIAPDPAKRRASLDFIKRCLEAAPLLSTSVVATETGTLNAESEWAASPANWEQPAFDALYAAVEELLPVAERSGAVLTIEGYVNNVVATHGQLQGLLDRYPSKHLQVMGDPYNYLSSHLLPAAERITREFLRRFEHRIVLAHLKDVAATGAEHDTPEFGTGVFPQRLWLEFLRDQRPDLPLILEHLPHEHIPAAIGRIHTLLEIRD